MNKTTARLYVYFDDPFWAGGFEREENGKFYACKITFGAEPKDAQLLEFICRAYRSLRFSPAIASETQEKTHPNPKRQQREAQKQMQHAGIGTKSQQALSLQHEKGKIARKKRSKEAREAQKQAHFAQAQQKRREKHRGR